MTDAEKSPYNYRSKYEKKTGIYTPDVVQGRMDCTGELLSVIKYMYM